MFHTDFTDYTDFLQATNHEVTQKLNLQKNKPDLYLILKTKQPK